MLAERGICWRFRGMLAFGSWIKVARSSSKSKHQPAHSPPFPPQTATPYLKPRMSMAANPSYAGGLQRSADPFG